MKKLLALSLFTVLLAACSAQVEEEVLETSEYAELSDSATMVQVEIIEEESTFPNHDTESETCTERVEKSSDLYGNYTAWPFLEEEFADHRTSELGKLFAHYACGGEEAVLEAFETGTNESGIFTTLNPDEDAEMIELLKELGFTMHTEREDGRQSWGLQSTVDILTLLPLKDHYQDFSTNWGGLSE